MAWDQARRLAKVEAALGTGSLQEQIEALPDMHLETLAVLEQMNEVHGFMDYPVLVRRFLTAVRRGRPFIPPGWTPAMDEEFQTRLRQLRSGPPATRLGQDA
jgi:hypothetical protein